VFDIIDGGRARVLDRHAEGAPGDGASQKPSPWGRLARRLAAGSDPPEAALSAVHRSPRILVVEDSLPIAELIGESLQKVGYGIVGPAGTLQAACALARTAEFDGAVLDLKLGEDLCLPIASILKARGIPFVVLTGYPVRLDFPAFEPAAWIAKPMKRGALAEAIDLMLAHRAADAGPEAARPRQTIRHGRQAASMPESIFDPHQSQRRVKSRSMTVSECIAETSTSSIVGSTGVLADKASGVRVLLVEGDPQTRATLAALLARQGFEVQSFDEHPAADGPPGQARRSPAAEKIACGKLLLDLAERRAWWDGVEVSLTAGEFNIVVLLTSNAGSCVDNRTVYDCLRSKGFLSGHGEKGFWVNVRSAIRHVRRKFRAIDSTFDELENARAYGYRWRKPS
jgi:DNA-binding response OmpR family regulator